MHAHLGQRYPSYLGGIVSQDSLLRTRLQRMLCLFKKFILQLETLLICLNCTNSFNNAIDPRVHFELAQLRGCD